MDGREGGRNKENLCFARVTSDSNVDLLATEVFLE
jgi:hypothetical protein